MGAKALKCCVMDKLEVLYLLASLKALLESFHMKSHFYL
jgi:hypothetical protein